MASKVRSMAKYRVSVFKGKVLVLERGVEWYTFYMARLTSRSMSGQFQSWHELGHVGQSTYHKVRELIAIIMAPFQIVSILPASGQRSVPTARRAGPGVFDTFPV